MLGTFSTTPSWITTKLIFTRVSRGVYVFDASHIQTTIECPIPVITIIYVYIMRPAVRRCSICILCFTFYSLHRYVRLDNVISLLHASLGHTARWQPPSFRKYKYINLHYLGRVIRTCQCKYSSVGYRWPCGVAWRLIRVPI